jgi:hypothetical protein
MATVAVAARSGARVQIQLKVWIFFFLCCVVLWRCRPCGGLITCPRSLPNVEISQETSHMWVGQVSSGTVQSRGKDVLHYSENASKISVYPISEFAVGCLELPRRVVEVYLVISYLWNVGKFLWDHTVQHPRKRPFLSTLQVPNLLSAVCGQWLEVIVFVGTN